ncbi:MAG: hypothetical protein WCL21_12045 [Mariniphaga sp.]
MKKIISLTFICWLALFLSCSKQAYYNIPLDSTGHAVITGIAVASSTGVSALDATFTVNVTFSTAKAGDIMTVDCLQMQVPTAAQGGGTTKQLLPLAGATKTVTVGADLKASVTYTRAEANLVNVTDYVTITFSGKTDSAIQRIDLVSATAVSNPQFGGKDVTIIRNTDVANFPVKVTLKTGTFSGAVVAKRKNGLKDAWVSIGSFSSPAAVPVSGTDFAAGKDTSYYSVIATQGTYSEEVISKIVVQNPFFFLKKTATLTFGGSSAGQNLLINAGVAESAATCNLAVASTLQLKGGSAWLSAVNKIEFVGSNSAMYDANNSTTAKVAFAAGTPAVTADPAAAGGYYIAKITNGAAATDVYYVLLKVTAMVPGVSVSIEYKIGDVYAHLSVIK